MRDCGSYSRLLAPSVSPKRMGETGTYETGTYEPCFRDIDALPVQVLLVVGVEQ
jgi:hypothetical protein